MPCRRARPMPTSWRPSPRCRAICGGLSTAVAADSRSAWGRAVQCLINHPTYLEIIHRHMPRIIGALESRKAVVDKENHT